MKQMLWPWVRTVRYWWTIGGLLVDCWRLLVGYWWTVRYWWTVGGNGGVPCVTGTSPPPPRTGTQVWKVLLRAVYTNPLAQRLCSSRSLVSKACSHVCIPPPLLCGACGLLRPPAVPTAAFHTAACALTILSPWRERPRTAFSSNSSADGVVVMLCLLNPQTQAH